MIDIITLFEIPKVHYYCCVIRVRAAAPQIIDKFSSDDVTVAEGKSIRLTCNATGEPHPEVTWFRRPLSTSSWPSDAESEYLEDVVKTLSFIPVLER